MAEFESQISHVRKALAKAVQEKQIFASKFEACELQRRQLKTIIESHGQQNKQMRQLRAALADKNFELKKLSQDVATERTMIELEKIKFMKSHQQKIVQLKEKMEHDNQDWIKRFDIQQQQFKSQIQQLTTRLNQQRRIEIKSIKDRSDVAMQCMTKQNQQTVSKLKNQIQKIQKMFKQQKQTIVQKGEQKLGLQLKAVHERMSIELNRKQKQHELKMALIQNEKKHEQTQHQHTKKQYVSAKNGLYQQVYKLTQQRDELVTQVKDLQVETQQKARKIQALNDSIKDLQIKHDNQIRSLVQNSKKNLQNLKNQSTGNIEQVLRTQLMYVETVEAKIKNLQQKHNNVIQQHKIQIQQIKQCYNERPSKTQDVDIIKSLKQNLWKKQKELQFSQQQVRWYKLQLDNKQQVYTKIFTNGNTYEAKIPTDKILPISPINRDYKNKRIGKSLIIKKKADLNDYASVITQAQRS